jgi:hypothetical protein
MWIQRLIFLAVLTSWPAGCASPEDGRPRGGGPGADGGNYRDKPIHVPSKLDGSKAVADVSRSL